MQQLLLLAAPSPATGAPVQRSRLVLGQQDAADLLLTALAVATPATAGPLVDGMLALFAASIGADSAPATASGAPGGGGGAAAWRAHPLARALLAHPAAPQPLALGVARLLTRAAAGAPLAVGPGAVGPQHAGSKSGGIAADSFKAVLAALQPFLSWALLDPQLHQQQPLVAPTLHASLSRVACGIAGSVAAAAGVGTGSSGSGAGSPNPQQELLALLAAHLPAWPLGTAAQQAAAAAAVAEVVDAVESCSDEPGGLVCNCLAGLVV